MKKYLSLLLCLALSFSLFTGCGKSTQSSSAAQNSSSQPPGSSSQGAAVEWPTSNVQIIVPYKAGGMTDSHTRVIASYLQENVGKPVTVLNQAEGSGVVAYETVRQAKPDGTTLLSAHAGFMCSYYLGTYDHTYKDFTVIAFLQNQGNNVFAVPANSPWNDLNDLVTAAKAAPGTIKAGITNGASSQFIFGALEQDAGIELKLVDGGSEADKLTSLQGGLLDITIVSAKAAIEYAKAGKIKVLASIAEERTPGLDYPTTVEQGFKNVTWDVGVIVLGPPNMDPALVEKISQALSGLTTDEKSKELIENMGGTAQYMNVSYSLARMEARDEQISGMATALGINVR